MLTKVKVSALASAKHLLTARLNERSVDLQATAFRLLQQFPEAGRPAQRRQPRVAMQRRVAQKAAVDHLVQGLDCSFAFVDPCQMPRTVKKRLRIRARYR